MESTFNKDHLQAASHEAPIVKKKKMEEKKEAKLEATPKQSQFSFF